MPLTHGQKAKLVEFYFSSKSIVTTQREFQHHFDVKKPPDRKMAWSIVRKFQNHGTVDNLNKGKSGRKRTIRNPEDIKAVCRSAVQSPKKSSWRRSQELSINRMSVVRILKLDLKLFVSHTV